MKRDNYPSLSDCFSVSLPPLSICKTRRYDDLVDPVQAFSVLALAALRNKAYATASKVPLLVPKFSLAPFFIKNSSLSGIYQA